ncbi:MAG: SIS domain-containing protein [Rhodospirillaceae bacterium]|nr:SIS domain-containing protein [Rhodospirillaceae bacterium]
MNRYLNIDTHELKRRNSYWTAREISQQPRIWRAVHTRIDASREDIDSWLKPTLAKSNLRILLCGAGTSAFIGDTAAAWFRTRYPLSPTCHIASVSTTDLTVAPLQFLRQDLPTLMISFARSGDSPESMACVELADQMLSDCRHVIVTCNADGRLARLAESREDALCLVMPEETNDRGFAMTSSYTAMLVSCVAIFTPDRLQLEQAAVWAEQLLDRRGADVMDLAQQDFRRLVVLGAGCLSGTAAEAALKCLELTAGQVVAVHYTPLGFRHGPKIVIDDFTVVVYLRSGDAYARLYDRDLMQELKADNRSAAIMELSPTKLATDIGLASSASGLDDVWLSLVYIVYCQLLAFHKAMGLGVEADSPCPTGEVNRVVNGVTIYPFIGTNGSG